jgi:hypothetical protein
VVFFALTFVSVSLLDISASFKDVYRVCESRDLACFEATQLSAMAEQTEATASNDPHGEDSQPQEKRWGRGNVYLSARNVETQALRSAVGRRGRLVTSRAFPLTTPTHIPLHLLSLLLLQDAIGKER